MYTHAHTRILTHAHAHTGHKLTHTHTHTHTHTNAHTHTHTQTRARAHTLQSKTDIPSIEIMMFEVRAFGHKMPRFVESLCYDVVAFARNPAALSVTHCNIPARAALSV